MADDRPEEDCVSVRSIDGIWNSGGVIMDVSEMSPLLMPDDECRGRKGGV